MTSLECVLSLDWEYLELDYINFSQFLCTQVYVENCCFQTVIFITIITRSILASYSGFLHGLAMLQLKAHYTCMMKCYHMTAITIYIPHDCTHKHNQPMVWLIMEYP